MSMILQFRMLSDEDDNFLRDYEIPYDITLLDFHNFICKDLKYDPDNMTSFFLSDKHWAKGREFTLTDMGMSEEFEDSQEQEAPVAMDQVLVSQIMKHNYDRLIYQFDMLEDRSLFLELMGAKKADPTAKYPLVVLANGVAPDQFDPEASVANRSIFDEAMDDYNEFEGDDEYDDEY